MGGHHRTRSIHDEDAEEENATVSIHGQIRRSHILHLHMEGCLDDSRVPTVEDMAICRHVADRARTCLHGCMEHGKSTVGAFGRDLIMRFVLVSRTLRVAVMADHH